MIVERDISGMNEVWGLIMKRVEFI